MPRRRRREGCRSSKGTGSEAWMFVTANDAIVIAGVTVSFPLWAYTVYCLLRCKNEHGWQVWAVGEHESEADHGERSPMAHALLHRRGLFAGSVLTTLAIRA